MLWSDAPDPDEGLALYRSLAQIRGNILRLERKIKKQESYLKQQFPRKPEERDIRLEAELDELVNLHVKEQEIEQEIKFYNVRIDMYKALSYRKG